MGCDIHIMIEYRSKDVTNYEKSWGVLYYNTINPGRDYYFFNRLSGVRGENPNPIATMGWPADASWSSMSENKVYIDDQNYNIDEETMNRWVKHYGCKIDYNESGKAISVTNPDWHSHGHCTVAQMAKALRGASSPKYRAMMAAARSMERDGYEVRFLFFYDN